MGLGWEGGGGGFKYVRPELACLCNRIAMCYLLKDSVSFARTWETDINNLEKSCRQRLHTLLQNPSDNTINWGVEGLKTIAAQFSKPSIGKRYL